MEKRTIILILLFLAALVSILVASNVFKITYYGVSDVFGPLSVYPLVFLAELALPIVFIIILLKRRNITPVFLLIPLVLLVSVLYVGAELADISYVTSFHDSITHFTRGLFVTATGHSNPSVDICFDMQPGFFWQTALIANVCGFSFSAVIDSLDVSRYWCFVCFKV